MPFRLSSCPRKTKAVCSVRGAMNTRSPTDTPESAMSLALLNLWEDQTLFHMIFNKSTEAKCYPNNFSKGCVIPISYSAHATLYHNSPDCVEGPCHGAEDVEDASEGAAALLQEQHRLEVDGRRVGQRLDDHLRGNRTNTKIFLINQVFRCKWRIPHLNPSSFRFTQPRYQNYCKLLYKTYYLYKPP